MKPKEFCLVILLLLIVIRNHRGDCPAFPGLNIKFEDINFCQINHKNVWSNIHYSASKNILLFCPIKFVLVHHFWYDYRLSPAFLNSSHIDLLLSLFEWYYLGREGGIALYFSASVWNPSPLILYSTCWARSYIYSLIQVSSAYIRHCFGVLYSMSYLGFHKTVWYSNRVCS